nr:helix-turn-helix transcriptional regulator [Verrucomicrobiota bacterium JB025]
MSVPPEPTQFCEVVCANLKKTRDLFHFNEWVDSLGWKSEVQQAGPGAFEVQYDHCLCGPLAIAIVRASTKTIFQGEPPRGKVRMVLSLSGQDIGPQKGRMLRADNLIFLSSNRDSVICPDAGSCWVVVSVPFDVLSTAMWANGRIDLQKEDAERMMTDVPDGLVPRIRHKVLDVLNGGGHSDCERNCSHGNELLALVCEALALPVEKTSGYLKQQNRLRYVYQAKKLIDRRLSERIRILKLAEEVGVSNRTLELSFQDMFGMRPVEYIQNRRLNLARKLLLSGDERPTVRQVAEQCGIRHLGYFASGYRNLYGESPSDTLRRRPKRSVVE